MTNPQIIESRIHFGGGGKVAIIDFGRVGSDYSCNITRTYAIPADWTDEQVTAFEDAEVAKLKERIDPILDAEFAERWNQKIWEKDPTQ